MQLLAFVLLLQYLRISEYGSFLYLFQFFLVIQVKKLQIYLIIQVTFLKGVYEKLLFFFYLQFPFIS